jgi:hypothetical protein
MKTLYRTGKALAKAGLFLQRHSDRIGIAFFVINILLILPSLFPNLGDIGPWDEMAYVVSGRLLADKGEWPAVGGNPFTEIFYALTYLPYRASPFWLVHSRTLGKILSFVLLWLSVYLIARQLKDEAHPALALGLLLVAPFTLEFLIFPSDPLFAACAGFTLWQLLAFYRSRHTRHLWAGSFFIALAALARNDGLLLFPVFVLWGLILGWRGKRLFAAGLASILPFTALVGGYVLFYGLRTGNYSLGTLERTYDNFEAGQQIVLSSDTRGMNPVAAAKLEAQRYFGTGEENHNSVFRAIQRNPAMYLKRLQKTIALLPDQILRAYGIRFAPVLFLLSLRGVIELIRRKRLTLLLVLLSWPLHLASGFVITLFRTGHLLFPFYVVLVLAATGLNALAVNLHTRERLVWFAGLSFLVGAGMVTDKLAIAYSCGLFLLSLWAASFVTARRSPAFATVLLLALCAGLILHGPFPSPKIRTLGKEPKEQALLALAQALPEDSVVAACSLFPTAAKMRLANLASTDIPLDYTPEQFLRWMRGQQIQAVYVDPTLYNDNPRVWSLIQPHIGHELQRIASIDGGNIQILLLTAP